MALCIYKRPRSPYWYLRGTVRTRKPDGSIMRVPVHETTGQTDATLAETIRVQREAQILNRAVFGERVTRTLGEAALTYLETADLRDRDEDAVHKLVNHFGVAKPLADIDDPGIRQACIALYPGCSPATWNRRVNGPMAAILHANGEARRVKRHIEPKGRLDWVTPAEADKIIAAATAESQRLFTFLFYTGCRPIEAVTLDWKTVDLSRRHVVFVDTKNGLDRGAILHPRAFTVLANMPHREGRVFKTRAGFDYEVREGESGFYKTAWNKSCVRAGFFTMETRVRDGDEVQVKVSSLPPYTTRHSWATWFYAATRDVRALMQLGGWKTLSQVQRYTHVNVSQLSPVIEQFAHGARTVFQ